MTILHGGFDIRDIAIVDDNQARRDTLSEDLEWEELMPHPLEGPFTTPQNLLIEMKQTSQAVVCDHNLSPRNYAAFTGAELAAYCYDHRFPSVLVTRWSTEYIAAIRPYRSRIPVLLTPLEATVERLLAGFQECIDEIDGQLRPSRRSWQTLVRIERVDSEDKPEKCMVDAIVPAWDAPNGDDGIRLPLTMFPENLRSHVRDGSRFFAQVNLGAERHEDLFLTNFDFRG
ncbi:MAG: hypothetical protein WA902_07145 [Thermosynechococcaceae cyanobacterium]